MGLFPRFILFFPRLHVYFILQPLWDKCNFATMYASYVYTQVDGILDLINSHVTSCF